MSGLEDHLARDIRILQQDLQFPDPEREWRFHPKRRWRFDFAWPGDLLAVEVEGGTWRHGRHTRAKGFEGDCEKYNEATLLGWQVFRFTRDMIVDGRAYAFLERVFT